MRKIDAEMVNATISNRSVVLGNTTVSSDDAEIRVYLHGNHIWTHERGNGARFTLAGWPTATTLSRLRALGVRICRKQGKPGIVTPTGFREIDALSWYSVEDFI